MGTCCSSNKPSSSQSDDSSLPIGKLQKSVTSSQQIKDQSYSKESHNNKVINTNITKLQTNTSNTSTIGSLPIQQLHRKSSDGVTSDVPETASLMNHYDGRLPSQSLQSSDGDISKVYTDCITLNCITPQEMENRKQNGINVFDDIISKNQNDPQTLLIFNNWTIIIDAIYQNIDRSPGNDAIKSLKKLRSITDKSLHTDTKYRTIYLNNDSFSKIISATPGSMEYLRGIGFSEGIMDKALVMIEANESILNIAMNAIDYQIQLIVLYTELNQLWMECINLMRKHKIYQTQSDILEKCSGFDLLHNYNEYYMILNKLSQISKTKIYSRDGLILQIITDVGFTINKIPNDNLNKQIFECIGTIYDKIKIIETYKDNIAINNGNYNYMLMNNDENRDNFTVKTTSLRSESGNIYKSPSLRIETGQKYDNNINNHNDDNKHDENKENMISYKYCLKYEEIENRKRRGIEKFEKILMNTSQDELYHDLLNPLNWEILIDAIYLNINDKSVEDKIHKLDKLKRIAQKACSEDARYRQIDILSASFLQKVMPTDGAMVFLRGIGFAANIIENKLVMLEPDHFITDVAVGCIWHKIRLIKLLDNLQRIWLQSVSFMYDHPSFQTRTNKLDELYTLDLINHHNTYYDLLGKMVDISHMNIDDNAAAIAVQLLQKLDLDPGIVINDDNTIKLFQYVHGIYSQIKEIEQQKKRRKRHIDDMADKAKRFSELPTINRPRSVSPSTTPIVLFSSATTLRPFQSAPSLRRIPTPQDIMHSVLTFGKYFKDKNENNARNQLLSDSELAEIYSQGDIERLSDDIMTKVYEMTATQFQLEEYLNYVQHFKNIKKVNNSQQVQERKCEDDDCEWNKNKYKNILYSLTPQQVVHVMFYHTEDYKEIATSEVRVNRFIQTLRNKRSRNVSDAIQSAADNNKEPGKSVKDQQDQPMIAKRSMSEKEGVCEEDDECKQLQGLLNKCKNIEDVENIKSTMEENDVDHCLLHHNQYRVKCVNKNCKYNSVSGAINRYVQFHRHFYHNIPIDIDEIDVDEIDEKQKKEILNEEEKEQIQYKQSSYDSNCSDVTVGVLEFGSPFIITNKSHAIFKNPKEEILKNEYHSLQAAEWNELLRKCIMFAKSRNSKIMGLNIKEIVALKLYTDFDQLQREFRMCFREHHATERIKRQKSFYFWNELLEDACKKSKDFITDKLYHGINDQSLSSSTFSGTYYGPVSTTTDFSIAKGFAGKNGKILELYPSFGKRGLCVSWLSNFPDENEVLYMNTSFQISNIYTITSLSLDYLDTDNLETEEDQIITKMEQCILNSLQKINIDSQIISLNDEEKTNDFSNFGTLENYEKLSVLYLLYLQYKPKAWNSLISNENQKYLSNAIMKFRDQFITLAKNVKAVSMDNMSKLLEMFFYSNPSEYSPPILNDDNFLEIEKNVDKAYKPNQPFYFSTIVKLFPSAQQISISGKNFDWSLTKFIRFLDLYDFEFNKIQLQDIYIRHMNENMAQQNLREKDSRENIYKLKKLGWTFLTPIHLHRFGFEPLPELPFLLTFIDYNKNKKRILDKKHNKRRSTTTRHIFRTHSQRLMVDNYVTPGGNGIISDDDDDDDEKENDDDDDSQYSDDEEMDEGSKYILVDHNPKNCILSKQIFDTLEYKEPIIEMLKWRKLNWDKLKMKNLNHGPGGDIDPLQDKFVDGCLNVESLVLDPMPSQLLNIFCTTNSDKNVKQKKWIISFNIIIKIFPNLTDLFLTSTTFKLRECFKFIDFINKYKNKEELKLKRIFFSRCNPIRERDVGKVKLRLKEIGWNFVKSQQMVCKMQK